MAEPIIQFLLFLLSFLMPYALLRKTRVFPQAVNLIISVAIAFYFLYASIYFYENIIEVLAYSVLALFAVFTVALIWFGMKKEKKT